LSREKDFDLEADVLDNTEGNMSSESGTAKVCH
jgi:hypothetical protein